MVCKAFWGDNSDWSKPLFPVIWESSRGKLANDMDEVGLLGVEPDADGLACCCVGAIVGVKGGFEDIG